MPSNNSTAVDITVVVPDSEADLAMIQVENTIAGRVSDIHSLLPGTSLQIVGEKRDIKPQIEKANGHIIAIVQGRVVYV